MQSFEMRPNTIIILRILRFHNCEECVRKVEIALHRIGGVELVGFDPVSGNFTISTAKHPEVIKDAMERKTKKEVVIIIPQYQNPNPIVPLQPQGTFIVQELADALLRVSRVEGLDRVELIGDLNSNSFRLNFSHRYNDVVIEDNDTEFFPPLPRTTVEPPSVSMAETTSDQVQVYGYPPEYYGFGTTCNHDHPRCCVIL